MTTDTLAKLYPTLTVRERLALQVAAIARGDEEEVARLLAAAPRVTLTCPDTTPAFAALLEVLRTGYEARLEVLGRFLLAAAVTATASAKDKHCMTEMTQLYGYQVRAHREGWVTFLERNGFDPAAADLLFGDPTWLEAGERGASEISFTDAQMAEYAERMFGTADRMKTAGWLFDQLQQIYDEALRRWCVRPGA